VLRARSAAIDRYPNTGCLRKPMRISRQSSYGRTRSSGKRPAFAMRQRAGIDLPQTVPVSWPDVYSEPGRLFRAGCLRPCSPAPSWTWPNNQTVRVVTTDRKLQAYGPITCGIVATVSGSQRGGFSGPGISSYIGRRPTARLRSGEFSTMVWTSSANCPKSIVKTKRLKFSQRTVDSRD
jgi:hypothetical protein